jgi:hypothetical protein
MLPKQNKNYTSYVNYRPISFLHSSDKFFKEILLKRFNFTLKELNVERINMTFSAVTEQRHELLLLIDCIPLEFRLI